MDMSSGLKGSWVAITFVILPWFRRDVLVY